MDEINYNVILETKNLILRPLKKSDAVSIAKYLQEKENSKNTLSFPYPYSLEEAHKFIKKTNVFKKNGLFRLYFGVYHKELKEIIGVVSLIKIDLNNKNCESVSWIGKPFWGTGLIYEAKLEMYRYAFEKLKLKKICSKVFTSNIRSYKHLEKLGFVRQGVFRKHLFKEGKFVDAYHYEILKEEFRYSFLKKNLLK